MALACYSPVLEWTVTSQEKPSSRRPHCLFSQTHSFHPLSLCNAVEPLFLLLVFSPIIISARLEGASPGHGWSCVFASNSEVIRIRSIQNWCVLCLRIGVPMRAHTPQLRVSLSSTSCVGGFCCPQPALCGRILTSSTTLQGRILAQHW